VVNRGSERVPYVGAFRSWQRGVRRRRNCDKNVFGVTSVPSRPIHATISTKGHAAGWDDGEMCGINSFWQPASKKKTAASLPADISNTLDLQKILWSRRNLFRKW
jgi:hypothetical protein